MSLPSIRQVLGINGASGQAPVYLGKDPGKSICFKLRILEN